MKTYCYDCGAKLEFSPRDKPKFCAKCGVSLAGTKEELAPPASTEAEEEDALRVPSVSGLDFDFIQDTTTNKKMTLGSVMGTLDPDQIQGRALGSGEKVTQEQAMEHFKKEAESIRQSPKKKDAQT